MSSKFSAARPRRITPPQCKKKIPPMPGTTPVVRIPDIDGQIIYGTIHWQEISPIRPWNITSSFQLRQTTPTKWTMENELFGNVEMELSVSYDKSAGGYQIRGSIKVDGILEDTILPVIKPYQGGQPWQIPYAWLQNTHPPSPSAASVSAGFSV